MKQKLILLTSVVGLTVISQSTHSLGMGKIQVHSALNEPLRSSIDLITSGDEDLQNLTVSLASQADYQKVGLDKSFVPANILVAFDPENPYQVNVTSNGPVSEPIVSLLLDVNWSNGRILREFTVLLDPPVYESSANSVMVEPVAVQNVAEQAVEEVVEEEPVIVTELIEPEPAVTEVLSEPVQTETTASEPVATVVEAPVYDRPDEVVVQAGDTLWRIANDNKVADLTTHQMMMAIFNGNPDAFLDNNINQLLKGSRLQIPTAEEARAIGFAEALAEVESHHQSWSPAQDTYSSYQVSQTEQPAESEPVESSLDYGVQLSGSDSSGSDDGQSNAEAGDTEQVQGLQEDLYNADSENEDLKERISELENIVEQQQEAIDIQDSGLANLENQLGEASDQAEQTVDDTLETAASDLGEATDDVWSTATDSSDATGDDATDSGDLEINVTAAEPNTEDVISSMGDDSADVPTEVDGGESDVAETGVAETSASDEAQPAVPKFGATASSDNASFVDRTINWVMDNLKWVLGGLLGLILLIAVPRFLRSEDKDVAEETSFLDDIKQRGGDDGADAEEDQAAFASEDDTKMNEPLLLDDEVVDEAGGEDDILAELDQSISFDETGTDADTDEGEDLDDDFDLEGLLNADDNALEEPDEDVEFNLDELVDDAEEIVEGTVDEAEDFIDEIEESAEELIEDVEEAEDEISSDLLDDELVFDDEDDAAEEVSSDGDDDFEFDDDDFDFNLDDELDELEQSAEEELAVLDSDDSDDTFDEVLDVSDDATEELTEDEEEMEEDVELGIEDLLDEGDAIDTKMDLAKAYLDMGDLEGAKNLLEEVMVEGTTEQIEAAKEMLKDL